jgi:putative peptide zinc metalloprotease protein
MRKVKKLRATAFVIAALALVAGILLIPSPLRVQGTFVLKLAKPEVIYVGTEGRLMELNVENGQWITKDTVLAKLSNPEKQKELLQRQQDQEVSFTKFLFLNQNPDHRAQAMQNKRYADKLEPMIMKITDEIGKLTLVSNRDGQVVGAPHRSSVGQWLKPGRPSDPETRADKPFFCEIGDPHHLEAHMILDQSDINLIRLNNRAWLKVSGKAETTYQSMVSEIASRKSDEVPTELSNLAEGEVASKPNRETGAAKPLTAVYEIIIPVENPHLVLEPGLRGFAKIAGGRSSWYQGTLAWRLLRWWNKVFNFQI